MDFINEIDNAMYWLDKSEAQESVSSDTAALNSIAASLIVIAQALTEVKPTIGIIR